MSIPRPEHPNPQFARQTWKNLNGDWQFMIDNGRSGIARGLYREDAVFDGTIRVPFCPESRLSGVEHRDFLAGVWYRRTVTLSEPETRRLVRLHFGAVDYHAIVYVNGQPAGEHTGGYTSFALDISPLVRVGSNTVTVFAQDDTRDPRIPRGKQSEEYDSHGCDYTRTTGIWQTVWLEFLPHTHIESVKYYPDSGQGTITVRAALAGAGTLTAAVFYEGRPVGRHTAASAGGGELFTIPLAETHLWEPGHGRLYEVRLTYGDDAVCSYFGLRSVRLDGSAFRINGKAVFQRLVLDQGFYPDGVYTAPDDEALQNDIRLSMAMGFNGARLHEKVFEPRFLYHCDRMGYLVWGEYPDWGADYSRPETHIRFLGEWMEAVERDFNHPAIVGWCPHNEVWTYQDRPPYRPGLVLTYRMTKAADPTRPCIDASGWLHTETDIYDIHDYEQDPAALAGRLNRFAADGELADPFAGPQHYAGQPVMVSEYGGILWRADGSGWGYGSSPKTAEEFLARFAGLTAALLANPRLCGLCYTQLTDVEQEQNGLVTFDRRPKFDPARIRAILSQKAAAEEEPPDR